MGPMNVERILMAAEFAANSHAGQMRKYTGDPYIIHPLAVARTVAGTKDATEDSSLGEDEVPLGLDASGQPTITSPFHLYSHNQ